MSDSILTNDQLKQITDVLAENKSEADKLLEQIEKEHENDDNSNAPLEEGLVEYNPNGILTEVEDDDFDHFENIDIDNINIDGVIQDNLKTTLGDAFEMNDEEVLAFNNIITRVRNKENFNVYKELPKPLKDYINTLLDEQGIPVKERYQYTAGMAKMFIDELISDAEFDAVSIDLQKALNELVPTPGEMYSETNRDYIENEFLKTVDSINEQLKTETDPEKIEKLNNISKNLLGMRKGYIDAYTYEPMYELFKDFKVLNRVRKADKLWKRVNEDYTKVAGECKFKLYPLDDIRKSLVKIGISEETATRIVSLFVYTYINGIEDFKDENEYNDIYRNSFANYFETNITNLAISNTLVSDFSKEISDNLMNLANHIEQAVTEREKELSNNKKKRR